MAVINLKCFDVQSTEIQSKQFTSRLQRENFVCEKFPSETWNALGIDNSNLCCESAIKRTFSCYFATEKLMSEQSKVSNLLSLCQRESETLWESSAIALDYVRSDALFSWQLGGTFSFASKVSKEFFIFLLSEVLTFTSLHNYFRIWIHVRQKFFSAFTSRW